MTIHQYGLGCPPKSPYASTSSPSSSSSLPFVLIVPRAGECISTEHDTVRQGKILLLLLLFQGAAAAAAAAAAYSALTQAHMDERRSRPRCPLACTHLIERRENPSGEIREIVPGHTVGDKVTRKPICRGMTSCVVPHDLQLRGWSRDECATVRGRPLR